MAEEVSIIRLELDRKAYKRESVQLEKDIQGLRQQQRDLNKAVKDGSISQEEYSKQIVSVRQAIKDKTTQQRESLKLANAESGSIDALRVKLSQLTKQRNATNQSTEAGVKAASALDKEILELTNRLKQNEQAGGDFRRSVGNYTNSIKEAAKNTTVFGVNIGEAGTAIRTVNTGIGGTNKGLKLLKVALVSTGIGALIVAFGTLVGFLTKSQRGMDLLAQVSDGVSAVFDVLSDRIVKVGEGITQLFAGDLTAAVASFKASVQDVGSEIVSEFSKARQLTEETQALQDAEIALNLVMEKRKTQMAELILLSRDQNRSAEERLKFVDEASRLEKANLQDQIRLQEEQARIIQERNKLGESTRDDVREETEALAELERLRRDSLNRERELENRRITLQNEINREQVASAKQAAENAEQARVEAKFNSRQEISRIESEEFASLETYNRLAVRSANSAADAAIAAKEREFAKTEQLTQAQLTAEQILQNGRRELAATTLGVAIGLFKKESKAYKILASGRAVIDTFAAANLALNTPPGPPLTIPAMLSAIALGLGNVASINNIQFGARGMIIPQLAFGGVLKGPRHAQGGIPIRIGPRIVAEAEGGETVLTRKVAQTPTLLAQASAINVAAGGKPLVKRHHMETGGVVAAQRSTSRMLRENRLVDAISKLKITASIEEINNAQTALQNKVNITEY